MKRISTYLAALSILFLASCTAERVAPDVKDGNDHCIVLTFSGVRPFNETKASIRGVNDYNENYIEKVDCFFYPTGQTGSPAVLTALGRGADVTAVQTDSLEYTVKIFITDNDAQNLFGSVTSGTCEAFVICNAPISYGSDTSVPALKEIVLENDFSAQTIQGSFVMSAVETATVTLSTTGAPGSTVTSASGRVKVDRSAAKMQIYIKIPDEIWDNENQEFWHPRLDVGVQVRMANLVKKGKVNGNYAVQNSDYVTTANRPVDLIENITGASPVPGKSEYNYTSVPFYSYPQSWHDLSDNAPAFVIRIPWRMGSSAAYEYRSYQLNPNMSGLVFERNHFYRSYVNISSIGGIDEEHSVVITDASYIVLDWFEENTSAGQGVVPASLIAYKYLVVDLPNIELNNEEKATYTFISSSPISRIVVNKFEYYDNTNQTSPFQTITTSTTITADQQTITNAAGSYTFNKATPGQITIEHPLEGCYSTVKVYATLYNEDNCVQEVTFTQNPPIRLECFYTARDESRGILGKADAFIDGFFARVVNATFGTQYTENTNYWSGTYKSYNNTTTGNDLTLPGDYNSLGSVGFARRENENPVFTTEVVVTSFNEDNNTFTVNLDGNPVTREYHIGDPRVKASSLYPTWTLLDYLKGANNTYGAWEDPGDVLITSTAIEDQQFIAPRFLVSSNCNAQSTKPNSFLNVLKRAATYQEAGFPAGRWRLPTEAEVAFIYARQKDGTIPDKLYTTSGSGYYAASGRRINVQATDRIINLESNVTTNASSRYVYDLWYWGDVPSTTNVYHPNGHKYYYDAAGNATLIK